MPLTKISYPLIFLFFCLSCKNKETAIKPESQKTYISDSATSIVDSLDIDSSAFITTNFPDTVNKMLYGRTHDLLNFVITSYIYSKPDTLFSLSTLKQTMIENNFSLDSSNKKTILWKHSFNRLEQMECNIRKTEIRILLINQLYYWGHKYQLVFYRILPKKKDQTVYNNIEITTSGI